MSAQYTIQSGDTLTKIAAREGYASWRDIYYHPENSAFRTKRPSPDRIFPGDVIVLPDRNGVPETPPVIEPDDPRRWAMTTARGRRV